MAEDTVCFQKSRLESFLIVTMNGGAENAP